MPLKVFTAASARNTNTVNSHAIHVGKCSFTSQAKNYGLPSPVLCIKRSSRGKTGSITSKRPLSKNILKKGNPNGAVKQWGNGNHDSKLLEKQVPYRSTRANNIIQLSSNNRRCSGERAPGDILSTNAEAPVESLDKVSTHVGTSFNSDSHTILSMMLDPPSAEKPEATQTAALLTKKISVNSRVQSRRSRFCPASASDTAIIVRRRQCVSCCPSTRRHVEDVTKNVDCSTEGHAQAQPNDHYLSDQKNNSQPANLDTGEIISDSEMKCMSLKSIETSSLNPLENAVSSNMPIETTATTSSGCQSPPGTSTVSERPQPVLRVSDISPQQTKNSLLTDTLAPSTFSNTSSQDRHHSTGASDILHIPSSPSANITQQPSVVSNSKEQARSPMPRSRLEELIAKLLPECSHVDEDTCFDQMVELALRILYTMYIKESNNRCTKASTSETDGNEVPDNPCVKTVKRNYKQTCKDNVGSSLIVKRWNPRQCIQDTKPILQVKYNAPVRPTSRSASRSLRSELRTKSESPKKLEKFVSDKPSTYVKKKGFVPLSDDVVSPKKAEKLKKRPIVASTSPRKLSSIAQGDHKVSKVIKIIPNLQTHVLKTEQPYVIINKNVSEKNKINTTPIVQPNTARVKKINYRSSNWCRTNDPQLIRRGLLNDNEKSNAKKYTLDDRLLSNRTKPKRCWTSLADQTPASVTSLRANSQSRDRTKDQSTLLDQNLLECKDCSEGKLTTNQQVSPKRSYGMENILSSGLSKLGSGEKRYAKLPSSQTHRRQRAVSVSLKEKPLVNTGTSEFLGVEKNYDLVKPNQLLRHQKCNCDIEKYKVDGHKIDRKNIPKWHDLHDIQTLVPKDNPRFCPQSWSVEGGFRVENSRNRQELQHQCCYSKQHTRGKSNKQNESRKSMKCQELRLKYNCENSADCQFSKHRKETDLAANKSNPNRPKYWKLSPTGLEYCNVNTFSGRATTDKNISTTDMFQVGSTHLILPGKSYTKESYERIDTAKESFQSGESIHYCSLPVNPHTIKNTLHRQYQQLPACKKNVSPKSKCHINTEPSLLQLFDDDDSSSGILPALPWLSPSDPKHRLSEIAEDKDKLCELDQAHVTMTANRAGIMQPKPNELECQNYLGDIKCECSLCVPKRRNLSRWHIIGHPDKDLKMGQRATISARSRKDDEDDHAVIISNDAHGRCHITCQQTMIKDGQWRMKNPCGDVIPCCLTEIGETLLFEGGEPSIMARHLRYSSAGDGSRLGKVTPPKHCNSQSELQQFYAENCNKNKSGISSDHPDNIMKPKDCCLQSALQQIYAEHSNINRSVMSQNDSSLNETNLYSAQTRTSHLEAKTDISWDFDKTSLLRNCSQFSYVRSDSGQSERVEMDNLIILKDANVDKLHSDSMSPLPHNLTKSSKPLGISETRWRSAKEQQDNRMISWTNQRETQGNLVKQNIPGGNQNYSEHPFICIETTPRAHGWNRLQVINVQDKPLDLSRKSKRVSPSVTHSKWTCGSVLCNAVPGVSRHTFFPLQSSPLNLSAK